jgi:methyltransferase-like protein
MPVAFRDLFRQAGRGDEAAEEFLAGEMLTCMAAGVVEWRLTPVRFTTAVEAKPAATPLARFQAERGYKVTNMRGETVTLDEIHRQTLRHLDGKREQRELAERLMSALKRGELVLQREADKSTVRDEGEMRELLGPALEKVLANLAKKALLVRAEA